ncbi:hypothetical protein EB796_020316 [Bugula neritina]|uniref:Uncharacterized protein n=1 Tax=Bugula neritina TaxID=10212 RepID=A0A7J7J5T7_BUGNE|nr:hypothetical protein EB796_020316 [Bugula neritina]
MKITVSQKAKDVRNGENEHAAIFTTSASISMKPNKTIAVTESPSISVIQTGNNRHKNEELLSKSINWKSM